MLHHAARKSAAVAYHAARGSVIVFGGVSDAETSLGDMWEWAGRWLGHLRYLYPVDLHEIGFVVRKVVDRIKVGITCLLPGTARYVDVEVQIHWFIGDYIHFQTHKGGIAILSVDRQFVGWYNPSVAGGPPFSYTVWWTP